MVSAFVHRDEWDAGEFEINMLIISFELFEYGQLSYLFS